MAHHHEHGHGAERDGAHDHGHGHAHDHGHAHGVAADADRRWLGIALGLITGFMVIEVVIGLLAHSLALLSDAAHMLTDAGSIVLVLVAMRLAARPAYGSYTFGLKRAEILSAMANGTTLLVLSAWLTVESVRRLMHPPTVTGSLVLTVALIGVAVNLAAAWSLSKANRTSLNVEGAFAHIVTDLFAFIATAIAGAVMLATGFARADAIASLVVVALMVKAGKGLVRASARIFLEAAPTGIDPDRVGEHLAASPHVAEVHDLHIWEITSGQSALSAHILVPAGGDCHKVRRDLQRLLRERYRITHATLQVDHVGEDHDTGELLQIGAPAGVACGSPGEDTHGPVHRPSTHQHHG